MVAALPSFIPCGCCSSFFHSTAPRQQPLLLLLPSSRASPGSRPPVPPPAGSPWHGHAAQRLLLCLGVASPPCYLGPISCAAHHPPARRRMALGWTPQPCRASRARHGMLGRAVLFDRPAFQARFGPPFLPCLFSLPHVVPDRSCLGLIEKSTVQLLPLASSVVLPVVDLASSDLRAAAKSIRQACVEYGFFYVANHGIEGALMERVFAESKKFFELPMEEKMALRKNSNHRGYTAPYSEKIDASSDLKESFYIGPMGDEDLQHDVNQWPSEERFLCWKETMKLYRESALATGKRILSLIALSLDLDAEFFQDNLSAFLRLLHYSAHSDYGMITLLATDGTPGLQVCREKDRHPQLWEDVHHIDGALIVNIGDLLERWTNCVFRSTLHRVVTVGKERCSMAFFIDPNPDLVVKCLESCCSEAYPPRFPPIRSGDYLEERFRATYKLATV